MNKRKIICIVGPTASGKTAMGVEMATRFNGEIVSADSRQVFRKLNIGTNKEGLLFDKSKIKNQKSKVQVKNKKLEKIAENIRYIDGIPQWLIDICEPEEEFTPAPKSLVRGFTMFDWLEQARIVIEDIFQRGKIPIVVGGTGLYVQALVEGFEQQNQKSKIKNQNDKLKCKKYSREELNKKPLEELQKIYDKLPTANDKLDLQNPRRLIRAVEKAQEGICVSRKKPDFEALQIGIDVPRPVLYKEIDKKVEEWFLEGIIDEVRGLLASGVSPNWLKKIGLNYRLINEYIIKNDQLSIINYQSNLNDSIFQTIEFKQMAQELKWKIHAYARRQMTWFRRFPEIKWVRGKTEAGKLVKNFLK